jgi:F0F1-type ATP synthase assembly protein I
MRSLVYGGPFVGLATGFLAAVVSKSKNWALVAATLLGMGLSVVELAFFATMHGWTL